MESPNSEKNATTTLSDDNAWIFTADKILFHQDRIKELQEKGVTFPVAFDIDLTNLCNHKCPHCNGSRDMTRYDEGQDNTHQDFEHIKKIISEVKSLGARSVTFGGGGDPSVYPHLAEILRHTKGVGLDIGMYTNGQVLKDDTMNAMIDCCTWIRISLDADGPEVYEIAHGVPGKSWYKVVENIKKLVQKRKERNSNVTIATCYLIGPKTIPGVYKATEISRDLGVDYIRIRPYFQRTGDDRTRMEIDETLEYLKKCGELETDSFKVSYPTYRVEWLDDKNRKRQYKVCHAINFMASITPDGNVFPCCQIKHLPQMAMGNIKNKSFKEVWYSNSRLNKTGEFDFTHCPNPCNYEKHIKFLWDVMESGQPVEEYVKTKGLKVPDARGIHRNFL